MSVCSQGGTHVTTTHDPIHVLVTGHMTLMVLFKLVHMGTASLSSAPLPTWGPDPSVVPIWGHSNRVPALPHGTTLDLFKFVQHIFIY